MFLFPALHINLFLPTTMISKQCHSKGEKKPSVRQIQQSLCLFCETALKAVLRSFPAYQLAGWHRATGMGPAVEELANKFAAVLVELLARV